MGPINTGVFIFTNAINAYPEPTHSENGNILKNRDQAWLQCIAATLDGGKPMSESQSFTGLPVRH